MTVQIILKRAYEPAASGDGIRILVERLWPRGVSKEKLALDHWVKEVSPSPGLRKWYDHVPARWPEFQRRYVEELEGNGDEVQRLLDLIGDEKVCFVFAARDQQRNGAVVLKTYLEQSGSA